MVKLIKEQKVCPVLGTVWFTGDEIAPEEGNTDTFVVTGYAFDPSVQAEIDQDQVVLIVIDESICNAEDPASTKEFEANRTGDYLYLKKELAIKIFGEEAFKEKPLAFIEQDTYDTIVKASGVEKEDESELKLDK